ncbi:MAG: ATP-grasp domain-containing protein [Bacteroidales bacterium]|nr:ATP-grasp domain-containing protein [Clostridium sp.]MCM1202903.1 ATP-grasp domain-containing protein [Bacteroidales bacterium]
MKKLVIIGANDFQNQLILKAKDKGYETHVFAWQDGAVGEKTADCFYPISIVEKEKILKECERIKPDGVISIASDLASITVNYVAEKLGLVGNGIESSTISTNKYLMRQAFERGGDPSPKYYCSDELTEEMVAKLKLPLIVKPVDRSGSRGITKITDKAKLREAIRIAKEQSFDKKAVVEEFVEGEEYSVEYVSYKGKHYFLAMTKKYTTGAPHFIETGHMQPSGVEGEQLEQVKAVVEHALNTLGIKYGASHSEVKIDEMGNIRIIEIGGRMGGDCIGSDLVRISTGYDFVEMVIDIACGKEPVFRQVEEPGIAKVHFIMEQEDLLRLRQLKKERPEIIYRISDIEEFSAEHKVVDSSTRYGYYITRESFTC